MIWYMVCHWGSIAAERLAKPKRKAKERKPPPRPYGPQRKGKFR